MGTRSRKRRHGEGVAAAPPALPKSAEPAPEAPGADNPAEVMRRGYARGRERDEAIRRSLEPLSPGERPKAVTVAAIIALIFAIANVVAALRGADLSSQDSNPAAVTTLTTAILLAAAIGMWRVRYWAVLGFQVILALQIIAGSLALIRVEKWWIAVGLTILIGLLGWLFWKLVRAMARIQMPARPGAETIGGTDETGRKRDVLTTQLRQTKETWKGLRAQGITDGSAVSVDFCFVAPGEREARALAAFLTEVTDDDLHVAAAAGGWTVSGTTSPMGVSRPTLERWVRWMVAIGFEHACEFDGWATAQERPGPDEPSR